MSSSRRQAPAAQQASLPEVSLPELDPHIVRLPSTTFFGRRLACRQIGDIQNTVISLPRLSRTELGYTICEHLNRHTAPGLTPRATGDTLGGATRAARYPNPAH